MSIDVKRSQEESKVFKRSKNVPREVMRSQEESIGVKRSQEQSREVKRSQGNQKEPIGVKRIDSYIFRYILIF